MPSVQLPTPALVVDLDTFDANVEAAAQLVLDVGKRLRPHVKTHRTPVLAMRQLGPATTGLTCATVGEAEAVVAAGADDVLIANELAGPGKLERAARLARRSRVRMAVDSPELARAVSAAATMQDATVSLLVDVDTGLGRCGVGTVQEALTLGRAIAALPGVKLVGIMGYEGRLRADATDRSSRVGGAFALVAEVARRFAGAGLPVGIVSAAGTSTLLDALQEPAITEVQAGTYALMEEDLGGLGLPFRCAVTVRATVVSRRADRLVLDAGRKTVGCEYGLPQPIAPGLTAISVGEEHTIVRHAGDGPALGAVVDVRPPQVRTTFNLYDRVWLVRDGAVVDEAPVTARGASQ